MRGQKLNESVEDYVASLSIMMKSCNFCDHMKDSLLRDRIVFGIRDSATRERLLQEPSLTVQLCIDKCRATETTNLQLRNIKSDEASSDTFAISSHGKKHGAKTKKKANCKSCAQSHILKKEECPECGKTFNLCKKITLRCQVQAERKEATLGGWIIWVRWRTSGYSKNRQRQDNQGWDDYQRCYCCLSSGLGASVNVLSEKHAGNCTLEIRKKKLSMYNGSSLKAKG